MKLLLRTVFLTSALAFVGAASRAQVFVADLAGSIESPPNASPATGFAEVDLNVPLNLMRVQVSFSGLLGTTTASHIHATTALPGTGNAGVATTTPTFPGFPLGVTSGTYDQTFDMSLASSYNPAFITANGGTPASAEAALFAAILSDRAYLNVHSTFAPGGEIRGFLVPVPEPGAMAMMFGLGVTGLLVARRRIRKT